MINILAVEEGKQTVGAAIKRSEARKQISIRRAKRMIKRGSSPEEAARNHDLHVNDIKEETSYVVNKRSHQNGGIVQLGDFEKFSEAEWTAENLKRRDQSGDYSYEAVEIDELSRKTLASYTKKSAEDYAYKAQELQRVKGTRDSVDRVTNTNDMSPGLKQGMRDAAYKETDAKEKKLVRGLSKRRFGIAKSTHKLSK